MGTINFVLVGARNTGKTCYVTVLASHCPGITTADDETTNYIKIQQVYLEAGELPQATASTLRELKFRYSNKSYKVEFSIDDYDGSFIESLSRQQTEDDESRITLKARIQESEGLIFFMPYENQHNESALASFETEINTIISLVEEITDGKYVHLPIPVCICITKWDRSSQYQQENETEASQEYIRSISQYNRAYSKLKALFENVTIIPISAFGTSKDGIHPNKGSISAYQLEKPIDYCLDKIYSRYDQKIHDLKKTGSRIELLDYLHELYDDLKNYRQGEYCKLYNILEQKFAEKILEDITINKKTVLTEKQISVYNCIRQDVILDKIDNAISKNKSKKSKKSKNKIIFLIILFLSIGSALGGYYLKIEEKKQFHQLVKLLNNDTIPLSELIPKANKFYNQWQEIYGLPIKYLFADDLFLTKNKINSEIRKKQTLLSESAKNSTSPDVETKNKILIFQNVIESWVDIDIVSSFQDNMRPILASYTFSENLRVRDNKKDNYSIDDYISLKSEYENKLIQWKKDQQILDNIYQEIRKKLFSDVNKAISQEDVNTLNANLENLEKFSKLNVQDDEKDLIFNLNRAIKDAERKKSLNTLLKKITKTKDFSNFENLCNDCWRNDYTEQDEEKITEQLQNQYNELERKDIPALKNLKSYDGIDNKRSELEEINKASNLIITIKDKDKTVYTFRYKRSEKLKAKFENWKNKLNFYDKAIREGVHVFITFKSTQKDNPLGFKCGGINSDDDIELEIDDNEFKKNGSEECEKNGNTSSITWLKPTIKIKQERYNIKVKEIDPINDDVWSGVIKIKTDHIIELINEGKVEVPLIGTINTKSPYSLIFSKN